MIEITYHFKFPETGEETLSYGFALDEHTLSFVPKEDTSSEAASWAQLEYKQCKNCELSKEEFPHCPIAKNLGHLINFFKDIRSYKKSMVFVETKDRAYALDTSVQQGLFSIFGVIMATSGCTHMNFLKLMARFHLPFATAEETIFRSASAHLLKKYMQMSLQKRDTKVDLDELVQLYKKVEVVNRGFFERISSVSPADANKNALVILDNFAQIIDMEISSNLSSLQEIVLGPS